MGLTLPHNYKERLVIPKDSKVLRTKLAYDIVLYFLGLNHNKTLFQLEIRN